MQPGQVAKQRHVQIGQQAQQPVELDVLLEVAEVVQLPQGLPGAEGPRERGGGVDEQEYEGSAHDEVDHAAHKSHAREMAVAARVEEQCEEKALGDESGTN